ncbi:hypothetical protein [Thermogutta sp.]|uniref:hypothetical protein n=1 Tax=Thermogutta sp. TaxID=1962930 RepID=UPI0032203AC1
MAMPSHVEVLTQWGHKRQSNFVAVRQYSRIGVLRTWHILVLTAAFAAWHMSPLLAIEGVFNGSFEQDNDRDGTPDGWRTAGRGTIVQRLERVPLPEGGYAARLTCTQFEGGFPDSHAMLCQLNVLSVKRGQWYRLRLRAKAEELVAGSVSVALVNYRNWTPTGLQEVFSPTSQWESFEFYFRATTDLPAEESRFQIYFQSTGTLWLDDVELTPVPGFRPQRLPQLVTTGDKNFLPNSSFELGGFGWGSLGQGRTTWAANLFRLEGELDESQAYHGHRSWKLTVSHDKRSRIYFDYFDPSVTEVRRFLIAHEGWVALEPGNTYEFSAAVKGTRPGVPVVIQIRQDDRTRTWNFQAGSQWQRLTVRFSAEGAYAYGAIGLDASNIDEDTTLWVDAVQFRRVSAPEDSLSYAPARLVESCVVTDQPGNIFTAPDRGLTLRLRAYNADSKAHRLRGKLSIDDYRDRTVHTETVAVDIPPDTCVEKVFDSLLVGKKGFFRITWQPEGEISQVLRAALIEPYREQDSAFGMNHAFPVDFLIPLAHQAGLRWWRDWSCQWRLIQSAPDAPFDFAIPDQQIDRVLALNGEVLMLLPFPATPWAAAADLERIAQEAQSNSYLKERLVIAQKPKNISAFGAYVRAAMTHYRNRLRCIEILNEPLFTSYALPNSYGWNVFDYIDLLRSAYRAAKEVDPDCVVVGGIAAPPESRWVRDFIEAGGLAWCDVMNLHLYPHRGSPDTYEEAFLRCRDMMRQAGFASKPIWVTEIGCYADDDPPLLPFRVGDDAMNRSLRPSEWRASIDLVKFAAVMGAAGVTKIFYHAGTCGSLNENTAGNIFFEYGGCPRKMYAAQAALAQFLSPDLVFQEKETWHPSLQVYRFQSRGREVVILWAKKPMKWQVPALYEAFDLMGNRLAFSELTLDDEPLYLVRKGP